MPLLSSALRLARWTAPSAVAACIGAVVAGTVESLGTTGVLGIAAAVGFFALLAVPVLFVGGLFVRGMWLGWRPRELGIVEPDGSAPRLAGWLVVIGIGALVVAWFVYQGTWMLAEGGELRAASTSFAEPVIALAGALVAFAVSRPAARLFAELARRGDARWRRRGRATLLRPRAIALAAAGLVVLVVALAWFVVVRPRIGAFDTSVFHAPVLAIAIAIVAHLAWRRMPARVITGIIAVGLAGGAIVSAFAARTVRPSLALEIWGDRPIAGFAIDALYELEEIRSDISLAEFRPVDRPNATHPDIILVTIDTVRADHTPPYGGNANMPALRELGEHGSVFTWAFAPSNVTRRSIPAIVIGLGPHRIRGRVIGWALRVDPRHVLLAERLAAGGYETAGFMSLPNFFNEEGRTGMQRGLSYLAIEPNGHKLAKLAATWLQEREQRRDRKPLFLWMHILEPHNWTVGVGTPRNDEERSAFYDRSLIAADQMLAQVLRPVAERKPENAPVVIVTADHGEALGEHGHDYHSTDLYNSQMRVPLVIAGPGIAKQVAAETVSLVDLVPTIVELAGFEAPTNVDGRSLADVLTGRRASAPDTGTAFAAMIKDRSNPGGVTAFVRGRWKLIDNDGTLELYDIYQDPDERSDVAADHPDLVRELQRLLDAHINAASPFP